MKILKNIPHPQLLKEKCKFLGGVIAALPILKEIDKLDREFEQKEFEKYQSEKVAINILQELEITPWN